MVKAQKRKCVLRYILLAVLTLVSSFGIVKTSFALTDDELYDYMQNNILFYDPGLSLTELTNKHYRREVTWSMLNPIDDPVERFEKVVETYGPFTMELQRYYGVPWEMPLAMMIEESYMGLQSAEGSPNVKAKELNDYNLLSLVDSEWLNDFYEKDGVYVDPYADPLRPVQDVSICDDNGKCGLDPSTPGAQRHVFKNFKSMSIMIVDYVIYHVRSGHGAGYDEGLKMLKPDEYEDNLEEAIKKIMSPYCVSETGDCYSGDLYNHIRDYDNDPYAKELKKVMTANNWENSGDLAKTWNIQPGGIVTKNGWGDNGWGDIRPKAWDQYGLLGLPEAVAESLGVSYASSINGTCFKLANHNDGGCTKDGFTYYHQWGPTWGPTAYACSDIQHAGCGPSAVAMVVTALTGNFVDPSMIVADIVAREGSNSGNWNGGSIQICRGGSYGRVALIAENYGLTVTHFKPQSVADIEKVIDEGKMMTFSVGNYPVRYIDKNGNEQKKGITGGGHFIAIRGRSDDGLWLTFDSSDGERNERRYYPEDLYNSYIDHIWASGGMYIISQ